jgi:hypothetical protein
MTCGLTFCWDAMTAAQGELVRGLVGAKSVGDEVVTSKTVGSILISKG